MADGLPEEEYEAQFLGFLPSLFIEEGELYIYKHPEVLMLSR